MAHAAVLKTYFTFKVKSKDPFMLNLFSSVTRECHLCLLSPSQDDVFGVRRQPLYGLVRRRPLSLTVIFF